MARNQRTYDNEYKAQAVKLAQEIGGAKAAKELGIPDGTIYCWVKAFKEGRLSASEASHTPKNALSLSLYRFPCIRGVGRLRKIRCECLPL